MGLLVLCSGHQSVWTSAPLVILTVTWLSWRRQVAPVRSRYALSNVLSEGMCQAADLSASVPALHRCHAVPLEGCLSSPLAWLPVLRKSFPPPSPSSLYCVHGLAGSWCTQWLVISALVTSRWSVEASSSCSLYPFEMSPHSSSTHFPPVQGPQAPVHLPAPTCSSSGAWVPFCAGAPAHACLCAYVCTCMCCACCVAHISMCACAYVCAAYHVCACMYVCVHTCAPLSVSGVPLCADVGTQWGPAPRGLQVCCPGLRIPSWSKLVSALQHTCCSV